MKFHIAFLVLWLGLFLFSEYKLYDFHQYDNKCYKDSRGVRFLVFDRSSSYVYILSLKSGSIIPVIEDTLKEFKEIPCQ